MTPPTAPQDTVQPATATPEYSVDVLVVGGGIAGLWVANLLKTAGYRFALIDQAPLGSGQTLASQGMIHGGLKYALTGRLTGASETIGQMPDRWRACMAGEAGARGSHNVDLSPLTPASQAYYMYAQANTLGRLTTFFASRSLRGRIDKIAQREYPEAFQHPDFTGVVYRLNDFVLDTRSLIDHLLRPIAPWTFAQQVDASTFALCEQGYRLSLNDCTITAKSVVCTAGAGAAEVMAIAGVTDIPMQLRPLHQVVVRHRHHAPMYAHCLTGITRSEPRLTITTHPLGHGTTNEALWYLGGQLATDGVERSEAQQIDAAQAELKVCVGWLDWNNARISTFRVDRAEPATDGGQRPDAAFVARRNGFVQAWPTKLSLTPDLGDKVMATLPAPSSNRTPTDDPLADSTHPRAVPGHYPWQLVP